MVSLRQGATRNVSLTRALALKFPRLTSWRTFLNGLLANDQERVFSRLPDARLCPVLWAAPGGFLVIMCRAQPLPPGVAPLGWNDLPVERKCDSFGLLDGQMVALDYGS